MQHISATVNLCIAATQNTTCVHNCRVPIVFCLILVVCVQCLLRIVAFILQHPVYLMTVYGPVQCDEVVQGLLAGEILTLLV